eukprot:113971-Hanusia_phi.AAC.1
MGPPALGDVSATGNGPSAAASRSLGVGDPAYCPAARRCPAYRLLGGTGDGHGSRVLGLKPRDCCG